MTVSEDACVVPFECYVINRVLPCIILVVSPEDLLALKEQIGIHAPDSVTPAYIQRHDYQYLPAAMCAVLEQVLGATLVSQSRACLSTHDNPYLANAEQYTARHEEQS